LLLKSGGGPRRVELRLGTRSALVLLPEKAVATLAW
jgi:hypothetical protein